MKVKLSPSLEVLSRNEVSSIVDGSLEILGDVGVIFDHDEALRILEGAGAEVDRKLRDVFLKGRDNKTVRDPWKLEFLIRKYFYKRFSAKWMTKIGKYFFYLYKFLHLHLTNKVQSLQERKRLYQEFRNEILEFINERFESPQFLWIHTIINHLPYFPPENSDKFDMKEMNC